jgi:hypothetical protein
MRREFMAARREVAHHDFAVDEILGATETDETDFQKRCSKGGLLFSGYQFLVEFVSVVETAIAVLAGDGAALTDVATIGNDRPNAQPESYAAIF